MHDACSAGYLPQARRRRIGVGSGRFAGRADSWVGARQLAALVTVVPKPRPKPEVAGSPPSRRPRPLSLKPRSPRSHRDTGAESAEHVRSRTEASAPRRPWIEPKPARGADRETLPTPDPSTTVARRTPATSVAPATAGAAPATSTRSQGVGRAGHGQRDTDIERSDRDKTHQRARPCGVRSPRCPSSRPPRTRWRRGRARSAGRRHRQGGEADPQTGARARPRTGHGRPTPRPERQHRRQRQSGAGSMTATSTWCNVRQWAAGVGPAGADEPVPGAGSASSTCMRPRIVYIPPLQPGSCWKRPNSRPTASPRQCWPNQRGGRLRASSPTSRSAAFGGGSWGAAAVAAASAAGSALRQRARTGENYSNARYEPFRVRPA